MFGEILVFAAFLLLFAILIVAQQTGVGSTSVGSPDASDALPPAAAGTTGGVVEKIQAGSL